MHKNDVYVQWLQFCNKILICCTWRLVFAVAFDREPINIAAIIDKPLLFRYFFVLHIHVCN